MGKLNLKKLFDALGDIPYFLIKLDTPYAVQDFPENYPVGKDLDIITLPEHYGDVINALGSLDPSGFGLRMISNSSNHRLRFETDGVLHYQFDVTCSFNKHLDEDFLRMCMKHRLKKDGYYFLPTGYEIAFRLYEIAMEPQKKHHSEWAKSKSLYINKEILPVSLHSAIP